MIAIKKPYLLLIGDMDQPGNTKTAQGLKDWTPADCIGQWRFNDRAVDLGLPDMEPAAAAAAGAKTLVIGIAPPGGQLPRAWHAALIAALKAGLDIAAGLHQRLSAIAEVAASAAATGRQLHDVRHSDMTFPIATGAPRAGRRLLTVGTDCALGKKYTALTIAEALRARGHAVDFRATGQTGVLIAGSGVAIDAVTADFIAGAAETLSPASDQPGHWDIIEGQGSLFHPAYAGVTTGLLHGSQPDALVLCHDPSRTSMLSYPQFALPSLEDAINAYLSAGRLTNPAVRFVGVALNTVGLDAAQSREVLSATAAATGLPCVDPIRTGVEAIVDEMEKITSC